jgi:glycosyltransferase involved in cell wall biosynthesis
MTDSRIQSFQESRKGSPRSRPSAHTNSPTAKVSKEQNSAAHEQLRASYAVIIPCKDGEATIEKTLSSLLSQTVKAREIIVVDDASHDRTPAILQRYSEITVVRLEHDYPKNFQRVPKLINIGTRYLPENCEYLMLLGDDSVLQKDYVEKLIAQFRQNPRLKIASGSLSGTSSIKGLARHPSGSGRLFDLKFLRGHLPFPESIGWESWILFKGMQEGEIANFPDARFEHERRYGVYSIRTFGQSMYTLGYPALYVLARFLKDFVYSDYSSRFHCFYLLLGYVEFHLTGQKRLVDVEGFVKKTQTERLVNFLRRFLLGRGS